MESLIIIGLSVALIVICADALIKRKHLHDYEKAKRKNK